MTGVVARPAGKAIFFLVFVRTLLSEVAANLSLLYAAASTEGKMWKSTD